MTLADEDLVQRAVAAAQGGATFSELSLLRAIAATREEARRHELARQARERAGELAEIGIALLRLVFQVGLA